MKKIVSFNSSHNDSTLCGHHDKKVDLSDLSMPETITDDSLRLFSKYTDINLWGCYQITDEGLAQLSRIMSINYKNCHLITNAGLAYLSQARGIHLYGCHQITDKGLENLSQATIDLYDCRNITNAGLDKFKILNPTCKISGKVTKIKKRKYDISF